MYSSQSRAPLWGLPDPDSQGEFYRDVAIKRAFAWLVDAILISLISLIVVIFTFGIGLFFYGLILFAVSFLYRFITIASASATPGMRLMAIELRNFRGERFDTTTALLHTLGYLGSVAFVFPQIISIILMATSRRGQGLSDMVLGTAALNQAARR